MLVRATTASLVSVSLLAGVHASGRQPVPSSEIAEIIRRAAVPAYLPRSIPSGYTYERVFFRTASKGFGVDFVKPGGRVGSHGYIEWRVYPETAPCDSYEVGQLDGVFWSAPGGSKPNAGRFYWRCYQPVGSKGRPIVTSLFVQGDSRSPRPDAIASVATAQRLTR